jgi:uncharacterized protein with von Willebrand factor type A (vWA) domain
MGWERPPAAAWEVRLATYRYSRWDGSQSVFDLDEDTLLEALSDDILAYGDLESAIRALYRRGVRGEERGQRIEGLRDLMERLKNQRRQQLRRHNIESLMEELKQRLKDVVDTERRGIRKRLREARQHLADSSETAQDLRGPMRVLEERARRSRNTLDSLPEGFAGAIKELSEFDFMDPEARQGFQELLDLLSRRMAENYVQKLRDQLQRTSPEQLKDVKDMLRALNRMLRERAGGRDPDFEAFDRQFGHYFDPGRPKNLEELIERLHRQMSEMQSLLDRMTPEMRGELESLMESAFDAETMGELSELAALAQRLLPYDDLSRALQLLGDEPPALREAMGLMGRLEDMDELENQVLEAMRGGDIDAIDPDKIREHLGEDALRELERLQDIVRQLQEAGYLQRKDDRLELTPRGIRKLAQQALREVFSALKRDRVGSHEVAQRGDGGEHTSETKSFEFGDPFDIDLHRTLFNAVVRDGPSVPVHLRVEDMEVRRTEHLAQAATVLLLDQSRSMGMFRSFAAAKKVALALYWLIQSQFPRDVFYVIGFSDYAVEITGEDLPGLTWNEWEPGTNMQHAFMLSRKLLAKRNVANKQVIMITDGEPTAHMEGARAVFSYPPSYRTIDETLKEVKRCTQAGIVINTFMLATNHYLVEFIDRMTRINRGRAFYTTPGRLGEYVMVDYLRSRRKRVA